MNYQLLGRTGLRVSDLSLGTMTFGEEWGWGASKEESRRMFDAYAELGGNFIDTANGYTDGTSECYVGEFVKEERSRFVVATKYTFSSKPGDPNSGGNDPTMTAVTGVYTTMWNVYLNEQLLYTSNSSFTDLNDQAFQYWDFSHIDPTGAQKGVDAKGNVITPSAGGTYTVTNASGAKTITGTPPVAGTPEELTALHKPQPAKKK